MFVSQAHSFRQQARLAITLAWVAGYTDAVAVIACGTAISHMTGNSTNFGRLLATADWKAAAFILFLLIAFLCGSAISGLCTETGRRRAWESIYVLPIMIETLLLAAFALVLLLTPQANLHGGPALFAAAALAAAAMGLQNATITRISGGQVRTTHVTGVLTDLGHESVVFLLWLRDRKRNVPPAPAAGVVHGLLHHPPARQLALLALILLSFILGAALRSLALAHAPHLAMLPPVAFLLWIIRQDIARPIAEIEPSAFAHASPGLNLPPALAVYHLRKDHDRRGRVHRIPNLLDWSDRLPSPTRVIILDLAEVTALDDNAILEFVALFEKLAGRNRSLILAGLNHRQLQDIHARARLNFLDEQNVCPDLELAIARGLNLLTDAPPPP